LQAFELAEQAAWKIQHRFIHNILLSWLGSWLDWTSLDTEAEPTAPRRYAN
jgi:hypothetical protein